MNDRFNMLRAQYRTKWDAYQALAQENAQLLQDGKPPSDRQLSLEQLAARAVEEARDQLLNAIGRLAN